MLLLAGTESGPIHRSPAAGKMGVYIGPPWAYCETMHIDWKILLTGLGLAFILEGLPYFLAAEKMPEVLRALAERTPRELRMLGLTAMLAGLLLLYLLRGALGGL